ncbi:unnamed protein product [Macrosiphum euphorbiae]|nr:unnamed protein product [Macrosiphum euphorbiae]
MSSDDEDVFMLYWWLRNKKKKRRYWIHPLLKDKQHSSYVVAKELTADEDKFQSFYRMSQVAFHRLVQSVGPHITKKDTNWRMALEPEEKLIITLR